jgi:hypothetical protein
MDKQLGHQSYYGGPNGGPKAFRAALPAKGDDGEKGYMVYNSVSLIENENKSATQQVLLCYQIWHSEFTDYRLVNSHVILIQ